VDRIAFTGNAAVFPRNKFNATQQAVNRRNNQLVNPAWIRRPSDTILATEFAPGTNWQTLADSSAGDTNTEKLIKSHRPVNPFVIGLGGDHDPNGFYQQNPNPRAPVFAYPYRSALESVDSKTYLNGQGQAGLINDNNTGLNAVARMHPGGDDLGGTTYFLYVDGAVNRTGIWETVKNAKWGDRFYSITGDNRVLTLDEVAGY
jgi:hypothetical protein